MRPAALATGTLVDGYSEGIVTPPVPPQLNVAIPTPARSSRVVRSAWWLTHVLVGGEGPSAGRAVVGLDAAYEQHRRLAGLRFAQHARRATVAAQTECFGDRLFERLAGLQPRQDGRLLIDRPHHPAIDVESPPQLEQDESGRVHARDLRDLSALAFELLDFSRELVPQVLPPSRRPSASRSSRSRRPPRPFGCSCSSSSAARLRMSTCIPSRARAVSPMRFFALATFSCAGRACGPPAAIVASMPPS